jgi:hypothetical protein
LEPAHDERIFTNAPTHANGQACQIETARERIAIEFFLGQVVAFSLRHRESATTHPREALRIS